MYSPENGTCIYVDVALPVERACIDGGWGLRLGLRESGQSQFPKVTRNRRVSLEEIPTRREAGKEAQYPRGS